MNPTDRFDIFVHAQPWQGLLLDAEQIADLASGELGASGVTLSVKAAETQDAVALSPGGELLAVRLAAGVLFAPEAEQYASTRLRPQVSPTVKGRGPVGRLAEICRERSLRLRLRISGLRDAAVAGRHAEAVCTNGLGLPLGSWLCPSNPDVTELVRSQVIDAVGQFEPDGIELENVARPDRYPLAEPCTWPCRPGAVASALLAICFCPSCRQQAIQAGLDPALPARSVQVHLKRWLTGETDPDGTIEELLAEDEILSAYVARQREVLRAAVQLWCRAAPNVSVVVARDRTAPQVPRTDQEQAAAEREAVATESGGPCGTRTGAPWNLSFEELAAAAGRLTVLARPEDSLAECTCLPAQAAGPATLEAAIDATAPLFANGPDIVRCLGDLARAGLAAVELENGLSVSPARRPFIRQAIRTARRERKL